MDSQTARPSGLSLIDRTEKQVKDLRIRTAHYCKRHSVTFLDTTVSFPIADATFLYLMK